MKRNDKHLTTTLFAWNDMLWSLMMVFLTAVVLLAFSAQKTSKKTDDDMAAGNISVYAFWNDAINVDMDIHLRSPQDPHIYYGRLAGLTWNLLRDDLGKTSVEDDHNFENAYSRGVPPGDYVINMHAYRAEAKFYPITIDVEIRIAADPLAGKSGQKVYKEKVTLYRTDDEATVLSFRIDGHKRLLENSVGRVLIPLAHSG